mmetsp:Transcript_9752/g.22959  ORF Transcript_9752/g.22959 Transcript_9752/m.22959 type:complete len:556 (+) Transcript_9752:51-1718(+)
MAPNLSNYRTMDPVQTSSLRVDAGHSDLDEQLTLNCTAAAEEESSLLYNNASGHSSPQSSLRSHDDDSYTSSLRAIIPTLVVSILLGLVSGTLYGFGRYARRLKKVLDLTQSQVQTLGICMDCGNYVGHPLTGLIYDRKGPVVSCLVAAVIVFFSYWRIRWTMLNHGDDLTPAASFLLDVAFCGVGFGSGLGYIAGLGSTTKALLKLSTNGSPSQYFGTGIGLVAASYGLSSTLVGISYQNLPDLQTFFLFWALIVPPVNLCAALMFRMQGRSNDATTGAEESSSQMTTEEPSMRPLLSSSNLAVLSSSNLQDLAAGKPDCAPVTDLRSLEEEATLADSVTLAVWESWRKLEFWLLFASFSCVSGSGLLVINNLSTMVQSMGGSDSTAGTLIIVLGISNVSGRILMGILGDSATSTSPTLRRIQLLQAVNITIALAMLLGFFGGQHTVCLAILVIMVAVAYGGSWVLVVALASSLFGKDHFGKDYGLLALGPAISGMIFNQASARWYEQHASFDNTCFGRECYQTAYLVAGLVALMGSVITLILYKTQLRKEQWQ